MIPDIILFLQESLTWPDFILLMIGTLFLGMDKAGLRGGTIIAVPLFAGVFGGRFSAAIVLPLLLVGDVWAVFYYRKSLKISFLFKMLPPAVIGLAAGMLLGNFIPDRSFQLVMAVLVLICLILMAVRELGNKMVEVPDHPLVHAIGGFSGGFTAMIGNAAGPIMSIYLISLNFSKEVFIGVGAIFFLSINLLKIPVHVWIWESMNFDSIILSLVFIPFTLLGMWLGLKIVKRVSDRPFRIFIILATLVGTIRLFIS